MADAEDRCASQSGIPSRFMVPTSIEDRRQHDEFALGEIDRLRGLPDQREADGGQRVDGAGRQSGNQRFAISSAMAGAAPENRLTLVPAALVREGRWIAKWESEAARRAWRLRAVRGLNAAAIGRYGLIIGRVTLITCLPAIDHLAEEALAVDVAVRLDDGWSIRMPGSIGRRDGCAAQGLGHALLVEAASCFSVRPLDHERRPYSPSGRYGRRRRAEAFAWNLACRIPGRPAPAHRWRDRHGRARRWRRRRQARSPSEPSRCRLADQRRGRCPAGLAARRKRALSSSLR